MCLWKFVVKAKSISGLGTPSKQIKTDTIFPRIVILAFFQVWFLNYLPQNDVHLFKFSFRIFLFSGEVT